MTLSLENQRLVEQVAADYVHHLFPRFRMPAFVACPDDACAQSVLAAITQAAGSRGIATEVIDLRSAPAELLNGVTQRLCGWQGRSEQEAAPSVRVLALNGFDLLEGPENDEPIYPFRSQFQFDEDYLWLFVGRDWRRLRRLFGSYRLPLYLAASDITPAHWKA